MLLYNSPNDPYEITMEEGQALTLTLRGTLTSIPVTSYRWKYVFGYENEGYDLNTNSRMALDQTTGTFYFKRYF